MKHFKLSIYISTIIISLSLTSFTSYATNYSFSPAESSALVSRLSSGLSAGDTVFLEDGTYTDCLIQFRGNGTSTNPIVLIARNPGMVKFSGKQKVWMSGTYLEVNGLLFKDGYANEQKGIIRFHTGSTTLAYNCRLTNCVIDGCNPIGEEWDANYTDASDVWILMYGNNNMVDHCYFTNKNRNGVLLMVDLKEESSQSNQHIIEYNFFGYREKFAPGNGAESIRLGDSDRSQNSSKSIVRKNFFYQCDGEVEIISIKSCDNLIQNNTFYESAGSIVCRHGHRNTIDGNVFIGNNKSYCGGVRVINVGHKVYNNYFQDLIGTGARSALCISMGIFEAPTESTDLNCEPLSSYNRVKDVDIAHNTFVNCSSIELGTAVSYKFPSNSACTSMAGTTVPGTLVPQNVRFFDNIIYSPDKTSFLVENNVDLSGITYEGNVYVLKSGSSWSKNGFVTRDITYTKNGIVFQLQTFTGNCLPPLGSVHDFSNITTDVTGNNRLGVKEVGAVQYANRSLPFAAPRTNECGVTWYTYEKPNY